MKVFADAQAVGLNLEIVDNSGTRDGDEESEKYRLDTLAEIQQGEQQ